MKKIFYGWWVVGGAFVLLFCAEGTYFYAFPVFFEAMLKDMEWSRAQTAAALSIGIFVIGAISPAIGILIGKIGVRLITILGSVVAGIGHTRWATHGEPSQINTHPHADCRGKIAVVHNGVISNSHKSTHWLNQE